MCLMPVMMLHRYLAQIDSISVEDRSYNLTFTEYGNTQLTTEAHVRPAGVSDSGALAGE